MTSVTHEVVLNVQTMADGAVIERLNDAIEAMLRDCLDPNLKGGARTITLELTLKPNDDRSTVDIAILCKTKGQPPFGLATRAYVGMGINGRPEAYEIRRTQMPIPMATSDVSTGPMLVKGGIR